MYDHRTAAAAAAPARYLLCASAVHCAEVLQASLHTGARLHGLEPLTKWPPEDHACTVLWALLPATASAQLLATEHVWRQQHLAHSVHAVHMLYGSSLQQAQQMVPWIPPTHSASALALDCQECVDAASEHKLFQHLLQRPWRTTYPAA